MFVPNDRFEILTPSGYQPFRGIQKLVKHSLCIEYGHDEIICSSNHRILCPSGWRFARDLKVGDDLTTTLKVTAIRDLGETELYDPIDVEGGAQYYSNDIVSHNCLFAGGELSLIDPAFLATVQHRPASQILGGLHIWERPIPHHRYVVTVDTAEGAGQDYSAFSVFDVTSLPYKHVAKFQSKDVSPIFLPINIVQAATSYNTAMVLIEASAVGYQVGYSMWFEHEYPNIFSVVKDKGATKLKLGYAKGYIGVKMTKSLKAIGCANLKGLIESRGLIFEDYDLVKELSNFVFDGTSFNAEEGHHDDLTMSFVIFAWLAKQRAFQDMSKTNFSITKDVEEDRFVPFILDNKPQTKNSNEVDEDGIVWVPFNHGSFVPPVR